MTGSSIFVILTGSGIFAGGWGAKRAETYGFSHVWTFDSHLLWEEPFVIYSRILNETHRLIVGPMVTNPATRDWTVTASLFATLNDVQRLRGPKEKPAAVR